MNQNNESEIDLSFMDTMRGKRTEQKIDYTGFLNGVEKYCKENPIQYPDGQYMRILLSEDEFDLLMKLAKKGSEEANSE